LTASLQKALPLALPGLTIDFGLRLELADGHPAAFGFGKIDSAGRAVAKPLYQLISL
jgi:hypothetical protein